MLGEILSKRAPGRLELLQKARESTLRDVERKELCQLIAAEFVEVGLGDDDEPTPQGLLLENLLDAISRPRLRE